MPAKAGVTWPSATTMRYGNFAQLACHRKRSVKRSLPFNGKTMVSAVTARRSNPIETADGRDHAVDLFIAELGIKRQRENPGRRFLGRG
jgi:hypothetical protein